MTTLAKAVHRSFELGNHNDIPVIADDVIYQGAAVGDNGSGNARPLVDADAFLGFAVEEADNAGGAAGDVNVNVLTKGKVQLPVVGVTGIGDIGSTVYATDDNTFNLVGTSVVGKIARYVSGTDVIVDFASATNA